MCGYDPGTELGQGKTIFSPAMLVLIALLGLIISRLGSLQTHWRVGKTPTTYPQPHTPTLVYKMSTCMTIRGLCRQGQLAQYDSTLYVIRPIPNKPYCQAILSAETEGWIVSLCSLIGNVTCTVWAWQHLILLPSSILMWSIPPLPAH